MLACSCHVVQDLSQFFNVDYHPRSFTKDDLLAVEVIEILRHLLARRAYNSGKKLVTDIDRDKDSPRVSRAEPIGQIQQLQREPMAQIQSDAFDAVHICI